MQSLGHVMQILVLIGDVSSRFVKELVTIISTLAANHFIVSFLFFVHYEVLVIVRKRVHVVFKCEAS